jgi:hypothetical protein
VRCSGARVFLTPSHVKESFTAAIVVRSLLAAERSSWVVGVFVGVVVVRRELVWPVSVEVVVAVDIGARNLLEGVWVKGPAAETWGGTGLEKSLAGDGFAGLRRAIPASRGLSTVGVKPLPPTHHAGCSSTLA